MAVFNPQEPTNDPNYLQYSHGISGGYGVDKSKGIALETVGTGIEGAVSIADTGVKDYLKDKVRGTVEKERTDYTNYLETLKQVAQTNTIPGAGDGDSLMDANASMDVPDGLQAGLDRSSKYGAASATGNKINDTLYTARLASEASGLRSTWSGYKDYIDEQFHKYSGMDPANAYYKNLMQDINTLAAKTDKSGAQAIINGAVTAGDVPNADKIWSLHKAKLMSDEEAIHQIFQARAAKATATALETARTARKGDRDDTAAVATRDFSQEFSSTIMGDMALIQVGTGGQTLQGQVNWLTQQSQNPDKADPKQIQQVVTGLNATYDKLYNDGLARAAERDKTGQSYIIRMGGIDKVKGEIEGNLSGLKQYITSVNHQQWGLGTYIQRQMAAQSQGDQRDLLQDPDMRKTKAFSDAFPTFADTFVKAGLVGNIPEKLSNYFNKFRIEAASNPDPSTPPPTMKKTFDDIDQRLGNMKNADGTPKYTSQDVAKLKTEAFNIPKTIADPKAPIELKANIARYAFNPENIGILQKIKMDYTDPNTGKYIPGKYSAFQRMTSQDQIDNLDKIRKSSAVPDGPQIWDNAKNWTQTEFMKLVREDIANLNETNDRRYHIGWVSGEGGQPPRMKLLNERGEEYVGAPPTPSVGMAQRTVGRINASMYNLHQFYSKDDEDTNMPILRDMMQNWSPTEKTTGLPAKVMDAIILANKSKVQKMEDTFFPGAKE
jgi:hypothetical protein